MSKLFIAQTPTYSLTGGTRFNPSRGMGLSVTNHQVFSIFLTVVLALRNQFSELLRLLQGIAASLNTHHFLLVTATPKNSKLQVISILIF